jgi:hypothetical protein
MIKHTSLLAYCKILNKKFKEWATMAEATTIDNAMYGRTVARAKCYITFYGRNIRIFVIS